jgi:DNA-directed RNA polymerase beta subunit
MNYENIKLYRPVSNIKIPTKLLRNGKHISFSIISENDSFMNLYPYLNFPISKLRYVYIPIITRPIPVKLTPEYRSELKSYGLTAVTGMLGNFKNVRNRNFILDSNSFLTKIQSKYKIKKFNTGRFLGFANQAIKQLDEVPTDEYEKVLIYSVSLDEYISKNIRYRKNYPILLNLKSLEKGNTNLPFDKLLLHIYDQSMDHGRYILLYDKEQRNNFGRALSILRKIKHNENYDNIEKELDEETEEILDTVNVNLDQKEKLRKIVRNNLDTVNVNVNLDQKEKLRKIVRNNLDTGSIEKDTPVNMVKRSVLNNTVSDEILVDEISEKTKDNPKESQILINQYSQYILPKEKLKNSSTHPLIKNVNPEDLTDNQNPKHIFEKRKNDFRETLVQDIKNSFKVLENRDNPFKVKDIKVKVVESPASELDTTIKDKYNIKLEDKNRNIHEINIDFPHMTDNGNFLINGQQKVITNQVITYPIFFFKPYHGKFTSSYSALTVHSKRLKNSSYLMLFMGSYKFPLILYLSYKLGFEHVLKSYNVTMENVQNKDDDVIVFPNKMMVKFNSKTDAGWELVEGLKYSSIHFKDKDIDLYNKETWRDALESYIGNRNCIYMLDQQWKNIVTPVEIEILNAKGDPTDVENIIKYIAFGVVKGRVDDRNSIDKQRIRTSEIFVALLQKQIYSAYNEYETKYESGDKNAKLYINSTKTFSDVLNSQNVQSQEAINPIEELAAMTKISPVGIGGIPDMAAYPPSAMNVHDSYYGNVDPLETPDGAGVGVQQNLTVGTSVTNVRGMINVKRRDQIFPSEILSVSPAMIPFVDSNDGCRVLQGASQLKQAVPLENTEIPAIQSGYESILTPLLSENFIKKSPVDGVITSIDGEVITIKSNTGGIHTIDLKPVLLRSGQGKNGLSKFKHNLKVGQKVKKDQIISEGSHIKDGQIAVGTNLLTTFMGWKGFNYEDGMVVSESVAKKFTSIHMDIEKVYLEPGEDVTFISDKNIELEKGGIIISYSSAIEDIESLKHLRTEGGKIVEIEVYNNLSPDEDFPEKLIPFYEETKKKMIKLKGKYTEGTFKEKGKKFEGILIKFTLQSSLKLMKGDKINNRHFNKGVISLIEKDENMPVTPWGERIDIMYRPLSLLNRMNTGQLCELHTGLISRTLSKLSQELTKEKFISKLDEVLTLLDNTDDQQYKKKMIKNLKSMSPKSWKELVYKLKEDRFFPLIFPPFKTPPRENILKALKVLKLKPSYNVKLPEYNMESDVAIPIGYMYVTKLEHMSEKKISSRGTGSYVSKTLEPTAGKKRGGGQKVGEGDLFSLLAWDCPTIIDEFFGPSSSDHLVKNEMISNIIQKGETEHMESKTNPVRDLFGSMMLAIHLESE